MDLYDRISRNARLVEVVGEVKVATPRTLSGRVRAVHLATGAHIRIRAAQQLTALAGFPSDLRWRVLGRWPAGGVRLSADSGGDRVCLGQASADLFGCTPAELTVDWPVRVASSAFDLIIEQMGAGAVSLEIGPLFDPRQKLLPLIKGKGVEVGPGLNPQVLPGPDIDVEYVEEKSPDEWRKTYDAGRLKKELPEAVLKRTRQGNAVSLDYWREASLDFIFSNHVFEHLMNPLQVLRNWLSRLKPGGLVVGVTPDARYSFDCRQPISTLSEIRSEFRSGGFSPSERKYQRWVRYTQPKHDIATLKKRRYSIHMHYYTPELVHLMAAQLRATGEIDSLFLNTARNSRDFGFVLRKAAR